MGWTLQKSLDAMDAAGVATAVVSTSDPCVFFGDYDQAKALARNCNEYQARMVADHKGRFGMFTTLPMPDPDNTLEEIAYGLDTLKAQGVGMMTSYGTKYLGDPAFIPVMEELNRRKAVLFVHRLQPACCSNVLPNVPDVVVEYGTETSRTIAESHREPHHDQISGHQVYLLAWRRRRTLPRHALSTHGWRRSGPHGCISWRRRPADPVAALRHGAGLQPLYPRGVDAPHADRAHHVRLRLPRRVAARHRQRPARLASATPRCKKSSATTQSRFSPV